MVEKAVKEVSPYYGGLVEVNEDELSELTILKSVKDAHNSKNLALKEKLENFCKLSSIKPSFDSATNSINCSFASAHDPER